MHAEVASITVDGARSAENLARLTELERLGEHWCAIERSLIDHQVEVLFLCFEELVREEVVW